MIYLALVLSPVDNTINEARKTRELWAASFIFSRLMYHLLNNKPEGTQIIAPKFDAQIEHKLGAGLYHDRCIIKLSNENSKIDIKSWREQAFKALCEELNKGKEKKEQLLSISQLSQLIQVQFIRINCDQDKLKETAYGKDEEAREKDSIIIHRLNRLLDNVELQPLYRPREDGLTLIQILEDHIHQLYKVGYRKEDDKKNIFISMDQGGTIRLPSVPEVALREFKSHSIDTVRKLYQDLVEKPMNFMVEVLKKVGGRSKDLPANVNRAINDGRLHSSWRKRFEDTQLINEMLYAYMKENLSSQNGTAGLLKLRHKYLAVVLLDGDGLGNAITTLSKSDTDHQKFKEFSKNLLDYAQEAVVRVVKYGGLPIFSGGDDLLFLAPVAMPFNTVPLQTRKREEHESKVTKSEGQIFPTDVFALCAELDELFKLKMGDGMSLSGGISINYYKFPLGEAVEDARALEKEAKKFATYDAVNVKDSANEDDWKPTRKKNALTFRVRKHSGQTFGATLGMSTKAFTTWKETLAFGPELDEAFLSSAMYRFQSAPTLLADVVRDTTSHNRIEGYKEHQFGKGGPKHNGKYLDQALRLAAELFSEYGDILKTKEKNDITERLEENGQSIDPLICKHTDTLFSALRCKQFLIQEDHD
ncbi:MAG: type III-B CRISPR-associated protein Cas10/Cmr2 [Bacteroidota bacterium]